MRAKKRAEPSAEAAATAELVRLAKEQGLSSTGPKGLLKQFTKTVLETAELREAKKRIRLLEQEAEVRFTPDGGHRDSGTKFRWEDVLMSRKRRSFTTEYKVEAARRVIDSGRTIAEVARDLGLSENLLGRWVADERRRIDAAATVGDQPLSAAERTELARLRKQVSEQERDIAFGEKSFGVLRGISTKVELYTLIAAECANFAIHRMARLLNVSTSGFYKHQERSVRTRLGERQQRRADLEVKILDIHRETKGVYGSPRITAELHDGGEIITEKTVAKIMRSLGIVGMPPSTACREVPPPAHVQDPHHSRRPVCFFSGRSAATTVRSGPTRCRVDIRHHVPDLR
jgi:transposase-like protein